jgi:SAM-dependent methyltransferase
MSNRDEAFWRIRSRGYERLEWTKRRGYLSTFLRAGDFHVSDVVLDVGTGTGIVAQSAAPFVRYVIGIDISSDMLAQAHDKRSENQAFVQADIRNTVFLPESFDKIMARMVFHHVMADLEGAVMNCRTYLRPGGRLVLSEGVPPHPDLKDWYTAMFALKEERRTFLEDDLMQLARGAGFQKVRSIIHISPGMSIRNWLENSGLPDETQAKIYQMHLDLDGQGRQYYRMQVTEDDILLDWKYVIVTADKL